MTVASRFPVLVMSDGRKEHRSVLVVGATRGIGREFVCQYAGDGWSVTGTYRSQEPAANRDSPVHWEKIDVGDIASIGSFANRERPQPFTRVILSAGVLPEKDEPTVLGKLKSACRTVSVNAIGPWLLVRELARNRAIASDATVVLLSTRDASFGFPSTSEPYGSSKAAANALFRSLSREYPQLAVLCISPGWVRTDMGGSGAELTVQKSVSAMRQTISGNASSGNAKFLGHNGEVIPW